MSCCCISDYFREPGCCDFTIKGGVAWHPVISIYSDDAGTVPVDLTLYTDVKMQIRNTANNTLVIDVTCVVFGAPINGQIALSLTKAQTTTLSATSPMPTMAYDLDISAPTIPDSLTVLTGTIITIPSYTTLP